MMLRDKGLLVKDFHIATSSCDLNLQTAYVLLTTFDLNLKHCPTGELSHDHKGVWCLVGELLSRRSQGQDWKLGSDNGTESLRFTDRMEEHIHEVATIDREHMREVLCRKCPFKRGCPRGTERTHADMHTNRPYLTDIALSDELSEMQRTGAYTTL